MGIKKKQIKIGEEIYVLPTLSSMVHLEDGLTTLSDLLVRNETNLFNFDRGVTGKVYDSTGNLVDNSSCGGTSELIKVIPGENYIASQGAGNLAEFDSNKQFLRLDTSTDISKTFVIPDDVSYISFAYQKENQIEFINGSKTMFVQGTLMPSDFYPYYCYEFTDTLKSKNSNSNLTGLKGVFIGDSMTVRGGWISYMVNNFGIDPNYTKICGNGRTITYMAQIIADTPTDADIYVVFGGTNDVNYSSVLGKMGDTTNTTFYGACDVICKWLANNCKGKRVLFVGSPRRTDDLVKNENLSTFIDAEKEVCYKYGIKHLDLYHDYATYALLADGVHFNLEGERLNGRVIGNTLNNM